MSDLPPDDEPPPLRIELSDDFDLVQAVALRECPGGVILLSIRTVFKHPRLDDARDGVAVVFGENAAFVTIPNLRQRYHTFAEPTRFGAEVVFVPYAFTVLPPSLERTFATEETVIEATDGTSSN